MEIHVIICSIYMLLSAGAKPGTCPRPQLFRPCNNRCVSDKGCQGTKKCCNNWCGHTCMEPVDRGTVHHFGIFIHDLSKCLNNTIFGGPQ